MGWIKMSVPRIRFTRIGNDDSLDWSVVRGVKFVYESVAGSTGSIRFDDLFVTAGADGRALTGSFRARYKYIFNDEKFTDESLPSPVSDKIGLTAEAIQIVIPRETAMAMDTQVTAIWPYIWSAPMGGFYRTIDEFSMNRSQMTVNEWGAFQPDGIIDAYDRLRIITVGLAYGRRYTPGDDPVSEVSVSTGTADVAVSDTSAPASISYTAGDGYTVVVSPQSVRWSTPTGTEYITWVMDALPVSQATITSVTTSLSISNQGYDPGGVFGYFHMCRIGGVNYYGTEKLCDVGASASSTQAWDTNPATTAAWTLAELSSATFGASIEYYGPAVTRLDCTCNVRANSYNTPGGSGNTVISRNKLTFNIQTSEAELLLRNDLLDTGRVTVPDNIIGIVGKHYDRTLCLTTDYLYFSDPGRPGVYPQLQRIKIADGVNEEALWIHKAAGAIYVGTTKDIYRIDGDLTPYPNGTLNVTLRGLNLGSPPVDSSLAFEGNALVYRASDGPRMLVGEISTPLSGDLSLLLRGMERHGIPAIPTTGRHRMAMADGYLYWAIPPVYATDRRVSAGEWLSGEIDGILTPTKKRRVATVGRGSCFTSVILRYNFATQKWSYRPYSRVFHALARTAAGAVVGGTSSGDVITLDTGTQDDSQAIPFEMWSTFQDNNKPNSRKIPFDLSIRMDTGGASVNVSVHLDGSETAATTFQASTSGQEVFVKSIADLDPFRRIQIRIEGASSTFKLYDWNVSYRDMPKHHYHVDTGNVPTGAEYVRWVRELRFLARTDYNLEVDVYFDDVLATTEPVVAVAGEDHTYRVPLVRGVKGKQLRVVIRTTADAAAGENGFELYWVKWTLMKSGNEIQAPSVVWNMAAK